MPTVSATHTPLTQQLATALARLRKTKKPRPPVNMYIAYSHVARPTIQKQLNTVQPKEIAHELGLRWKQLSAHEKAPYKTEYTAKMVQYRINVANFLKLREHVQSLHDELDFVNGVVKYPNRPPSAYTMYLTDHFHAVRAEMRLSQRHQPTPVSGNSPTVLTTDVAAAMGQRWRSLSVEERLVYTNRYKALMCTYVAEQKRADEAQALLPKALQKKKNNNKKGVGKKRNSAQAKISNPPPTTIPEKNSVQHCGKKAKTEKGSTYWQSKLETPWQSNTAVDI